MSTNINVDRHNPLYSFVTPVYTDMLYIICFPDVT